MGFGILFFGYFIAFAFILIQTYFYADVIGCLIMLWALSLLSSHKRKFRTVAYCDMALTVASVVRAVGRTFSLWTENGAIGVTLTIVWMAAALVFHFFLTGAIRALAVEAEDKKIVARANFNRSFSATAYVFITARAALIGILPEDAADVANKLSLLLHVACLLFMAFLIYSSFVSFIPVTGEVEGPVHSKIPIVNKLRQKNYERKKRELDENKKLYEDYLSRKIESPAYMKKKKKKKK